MRLALIGGGGFAKRIVEMATALDHTVVGCFDDNVETSEIKYLGQIRDALESRHLFDGVAISFGSVDRPTLVKRLEVAKWIAQHGLKAPSLISRHALVGPDVEIGDGAMIGHFTVLNPNCRVGPFSMVTNLSNIGHDAKLEISTVVAPQAFVGGDAVLGEGTLIGPGAVVLQGRTLGARVIVGAGSTVTKNLPDGATMWSPRNRVTLESGELLQPGP